LSNTTLDNLGKLVLRLTVGILLVLHGIHKLTHGVGGIEGMVASHGLPAFVAWGAYVGEVIAPILVIAGIYTRIGGLIIAINMLFAIALAHMTQLYSLTQQGGWQLELQGLYLFGGIAIAMLGAGRFSISGQGGRWN